MALRLSGLQTSCRPLTTGESIRDLGVSGKPTGRIRQRRHPAICAGLPDGAALIGPTNIVQAVNDRWILGKSVGRIRQRRHPAICTGLPDGATLIGPTNIVQAVNDRGSPGKLRRPDKATPPSGYLCRTARWRCAYRAYKHRAGR